MLPAWLDVFKVLLDFDLKQDVSEEHWDRLETRIQIFRVRTKLSFLFSGPFTVSRASALYSHIFFRALACPFEGE